MLTLTKPTTVLVGGPNSSGKTCFVTRFVNNQNFLMTPKPQRIVWCYGIWQDNYNQLNDVEFIQRGPDLDYFDRKRTLLVIDDLMGEKNETVTKLFTQKSHHPYLTIFHLVQNLFQKTNRTISVNSQIVVLFKNQRNTGQALFFTRQAYPKHVREIQQAFLDATGKPAPVWKLRSRVKFYDNSTTARLCFHTYENIPGIPMSIG